MLHPKLRIEQRVSLPSIFWSGGVAEWLGSGLQSRVRRFDSGPRLKVSDTCRSDWAGRLRAFRAIGAVG
ncbi:uncharacterized protein METZ01_LOCUS583 [marine metagenome]|uniref:Uncharacterized protein n=1 Tax=marine metagenome TaxID=408172 RepID=A0A381MZS4_9ZZZZ